MKKFRFVLAAAVLALSATAASADGRVFFAYLYGGNERPAAGDPDAFGIATVTLINAGALCYSIVVNNIVAPTAAHIHAGVAGVVGGVVVPLPIAPLVPARMAGCIGAPAATIAAIKLNPQNFYVNVHNAAFGAGAVRGQLQ